MKWMATSGPVILDTLRTSCARRRTRMTIEEIRRQEEALERRRRHEQLRDAAIEDNCRIHEQRRAAAQTAEEKRWATSERHQRQDQEALRGVNERRRANQEFERRRVPLLAMNWRDMLGPEFEQFLGDVFEMLGYEVRYIGGSHDSGIDSIVTLQGKHIGIQAKAWKGTVGREAVYQAYTGKTVYDCDSCAAITTSTFSRPAKKTAEKVGCLLINGTQIRDLICGRINLTAKTRSDEGSSLLFVSSER